MRKLKVLLFTALIFNTFSADAQTLSSSQDIISAINNGQEGATIKIAAGTYSFDKPLTPKKGMIIRGAGQGKTTLKAKSSWQPSTASLPAKDNAGAYIFSIKNQRNIKISNMKLTGPTVFGAIYANDADGLEISNLTIQGFVWSSVRTFNMDNFKVHDNTFIDAGGRFSRTTGGAIFMEITKNSEFWNNRILKTSNRLKFFGFKGLQGENLRFHHNDVHVSFSFEFPFKKDFNIEIDHNRFVGVISVPRYDGGPQFPEGKYSYHIHHNWLQKTNALEWLRNEAIINNNLFDFPTSDDNGNLIFGHKSKRATGVKGQTLMYNNLIKNPGRGIFWTQVPYNNFSFYNNHVKANTTTMKYGFFGMHEDTDFSTITIKDNIIENTPAKKRPLMRNQQSYRANIENNTFINITDVNSFKNPNTGKPRGLKEPLNFSAGVNGEYLIKNWVACQKGTNGCSGNINPIATPKPIPTSLPPTRTPKPEPTPDIVVTPEPTIEPTPVVESTPSPTAIPSDDSPLSTKKEIKERLAELRSKYLELRKTRSKESSQGSTRAERKRIYEEITNLIRKNRKESRRLKKVLENIGKEPNDKEQSPLTLKELKAKLAKLEKEFKDLKEKRSTESSKILAETNSIKKKREVYYEFTELIRANRKEARAVKKAISSF